MCLHQNRKIKECCFKWWRHKHRRSGQLLALVDYLNGYKFEGLRGRPKKTLNMVVRKDMIGCEVNKNMGSRRV